MSILRHERQSRFVEDIGIELATYQQFNVDVYKDLVLKIGYNLDDFQRNQFD